MRRFVVMLTLAVLLAACGTRQQPTGHKGQLISVTDTMLIGGTDTVRFGRMRSGEIVQQRLRLTNKTDRPLVVTSYDRTCGCVTLDFSNQPIKAGGEQLLTLTFDSRGESGWQLKTLGIRFAGVPQPLRIFIEADVE